MSPTIELNDVVKNKLDEFKEENGSEINSNDINLCLIQIQILEANQKLMLEVKDGLKAFMLNGKP